MDGIHDLGGMDGFGPVEGGADEPVFHEEWERRVFGMQLALREYNQDEFRHAIERMDPAYYLDSGYFEHWLVAMETLLTERDVVSADALTDRIESLGTAETFDEGVPVRRDPRVADATRAALRRGASRRADPVSPAFDVGDRVVVRNAHPAGHTRCPGYVRRARGTVERVDGAYPLPDESAHGGDAQAEPVYHVRFDADELWGEQAESNVTVTVDLWESYLEAPGG